MSKKILVVDNDEGLLKSIKKNLDMEGYDVHLISNPTTVLPLLEDESFDCILLDIRMPGISGLDLLASISEKYSQTPIIMVSAHGTINIAVQTVKKGAFDFVEKPIDPDRLIVTIKNAIDQKKIKMERDEYFKELREKYWMVGESKEMKQVFFQIRKVADTPAKVLILGESGTGKELVANAIHHNSSRSGKPYEKFNCATIPEHLFESELFGYKKGSFTGAIADHKGKFLVADSGTLFLDEIGDMDIRLQAKLLRALEENLIEIIGDPVPRQVDVRVIAATNQNLAEMTKTGKFREDLYHRLNVVKIVIPPLRNRRDDIIPIAEYFLQKSCDEYNKKSLSFSHKARMLLTNQEWNGNVRELRNIVEKLVIFSTQNEISVNDVANALEISQTISNNHSFTGDDNNDSLKSATTNFEKHHILEMLNKNNWRMQETANSLNIDRSNLFKKMKKLGISKPVNKC